MSHFGQIEDLQLGAAIGRLLAEPESATSALGDAATGSNKARCEIGAGGKASC